MNQLATRMITSTGDERVYFRTCLRVDGGGARRDRGLSAAVGHNQRALNTVFGAVPNRVHRARRRPAALVGGLVGLVQHMSPFTAAAVFLGYAALNGVTISVIFAVYTTKSIFATFLVCAGMFGASPCRRDPTSISHRGARTSAWRCSASSSAWS